jgi:hypothetical protein
MTARSDYHYTVKGSWPFPVDMLRRENSKPATPEDAAIIERLSRDFAEDRDAYPNTVTINLVIPNAAHHMRPLTARWRSFGWDVPDDAEYQQMSEDRAVRMEAHYASAMAKLTPEEIEALNWYRPVPNQ